MHEYKTARSVFGFAEFCGWAIVVVGVIAVLVGFGGGSAFGRSEAAILGAIPGLFLVIVGLLAVVFVQIGRAAVDTAEMTGKLLINSNEELKILRAQQAPQGFAAPSRGTANPTQPTLKEPAKTASDMGQRTEPSVSATPSAPPADGARHIEHWGSKIALTDGKAYVDGMKFETVELAKSHVQNKAAEKTRKSLGERS